LKRKAGAKLILLLRARFVFCARSIYCGGFFFAGGGVGVGFGSL
jgi:hypothetical protein